MCNAVKPVWFWILLTAGLIGGCASAPPVDWPDAVNHVIAINAQGQTVVPTDWAGQHPIDAQTQIKGILAARDRWGELHPTQTRKMLIFVHGGLCDPREEVRRAQQDSADMEADGYYPVFIVWDPQLWPSYWEHVAHVRRGQYEKNGWAMSPFYILADLGKALTRFPITWSFQIDNDWAQFFAAYLAEVRHEPELRWLRDPQFNNAVRVTDYMLQESDKPAIVNKVNWSLGDVRGDSGFGQSLLYVATVPLKFGLSPILDSLGTAAWDAMYRRAEILFDGFSTGNLRETKDAVQFVHPGPGALVQLIEDLEESQKTNPWEITLIGHSMGSIVLDEFVRRSDGLEIQNIVYMAAACSVRDFQRTVVPYLETHSDTKFYNLCLHPVAEVRDLEGTELAPRGSLLVWIDDMFGNHYTPFDRTLGRWDNIPQTISVIPDAIRPQVTLKAFSVDIDKDQDNVPQDHGGFTTCRFWVSSFWQAEPHELSGKMYRAVHKRAQELQVQK